MYIIPYCFREYAGFAYNLKWVWHSARHPPQPPKIYSPSKKTTKKSLHRWMQTLLLML